MLAVLFNSLLPGFIGGSCFMLGLVVREMLRSGWAKEGFLVEIVIALASIIWTLNIAPLLPAYWLAIVCILLLIGINFDVGFALRRPPIRDQIPELYAIACVVNALAVVLVQAIALLLR